MARPVSPESIVRRVAEIEAVAFDGERAHCLEDKLYVDTLKAIAAGHVVGTKARLCAIEALKADRLDFQRWSA